MNTYAVNTSAGIAVAMIAFLSFTSMAFAQSVDVDASVGAQVKPLRPIELLKQQREKMQDIQGDIKARQLNAVSDIKNASSGPERRDIMRDARMENKESREEMRELRGTFRDRLHALVQTHIGTIVNRFNNALERFDNLVARMESRIEKLEDRGVDTTSVEASLAISVDLVDEAKADVRAVVSIIDSVTDASDGDSVREELRTAIRQAIASIKAAHRGLLSTAKMLAEIVRTSVDISTETDVEVDVE